MSSKSSNKENVFVCGLGRSGTTWISKSLGQSKELIYIKEAWLLGKFQELLDWYRTIYNDWETFTPWKNNKITPELFVRQLSHFYNTLLEQVSGGQRFIEKTPEWNVLYLRLLIEMFPDAYFVLIYRDGRNYVKSSEMHRRNENLDFDFKTWCQRWALAMDGFEEIQKDNSIQNYMLIRYEDLLMSLENSVFF